MTNDIGRVPLAPGSREPSPDGLGPPGFDPSRVEHDECPVCPGSLDTGWECLSCGFDAYLIAITAGQATQ